MAQTAASVQYSQLDYFPNLECFMKIYRTRLEQVVLPVFLLDAYTVPNFHCEKRILILYIFDNSVVDRPPY